MNSETETIKNLKLKIELLQKLFSFLQLEANWDGYGAKKIPKQVIQKAAKILDTLDHLPKIFPTGRESVQLEYEMNDRYIEFEIFKDKIGYFKNYNGVEDEGELNEIQIPNFVAEIYGNTSF